ncbi:MAG: DUF5596 domain-containing protein [Lentisphaeria bacterium]|nr:DUF5596 domain-containing protein [Lentisphaeria bacterium]
MERQAADFPGIENIAFLQDDFIRHYSAMAAIDETTIEEIIRLKDMLLHKESFVRLLWEFHDLLYRQYLPLGEVIPEDPNLGRLLEDGLSGVFYYLLILSGFPLAEQRYEERGWPESLRDEIFSDISVWVAHHKRNFGTPGLAWMVMPWFQGHINLTLVAFGRLQFNVSFQFMSKVNVYRNIHDNSVKVLYAESARFRKDGLLDDLQEDAADGSWYSEFIETDHSWKGNPVQPNGYTSIHPVELLKSEWKEVLKYGDPVINIHIPESGPLKAQACKESMIRAREFFAEYLPAYQWKAFFCDSWLLDPQLQSILPPESNIREFQRNGYLIPFPGEADTVFRCFGVKASRDGVGTVPLISSLQQKLASFLKDGGRFHYGAAFLLKEDMETSNPYHQEF